MYLQILIVLSSLHLQTKKVFASPIKLSFNCLLFVLEVGIFLRIYLQTSVNMNHENTTISPPLLSLLAPV